MSGNMVALGEVAEFVRGINFKPDDVVPVGTPETVACMRTKNVQSALDLSDVWAVHESFMRRDDQCLQEGDILVSSANSWNLVGKCSWIPVLPYRATFGGFVSVLRATSSDLDRRYLYRWFSSEYVQETLRSFGQKTTNISNLNLGRCGRLQLPVPPLEEQRRIAAILDQAETLRTQRRQALAHLDSLTQSLFLDMFGDPATNPNSWPVKTLKELGKVITGGTPPSSKEGMFDGPIPFMTPGDLESEVPVRRSITEAGAKEVDLVRAGSTLVCCIGATIGKVGMAHKESAFNQQLNAVVWGKDINDHFGYEVMRFFKPTIVSWGASTTLPILKKSSFERIEIPVPPLNLQEIFASRLQKISDLKGLHKSALADLDELFGALQSKAFAGEL